MTQRVFRLGLCALLAGAVACYVEARAWNARTRDSRPFGRYTARQILDRSEPICRELAPPGGDVVLTADRVRARRRDAATRFWCVDCYDRAGRHLAYLVWDADDGELRSVGCAAYPGVSAGERRVESPRAAVQAAWTWLCDLDIAGQSAEWRRSGAPVPCGSAWRVVWQAGDRQIAVVVDMETARLKRIGITPAHPGP